jgi:hypothetical protein
MGFKTYFYESKDFAHRDVLGLVYMMEMYDQGLMNESELLNEANINDYLKKFGLKFHKEGPGLIDYIKDFTKGAGKLIVAAVKGNKEEVKRIAQTITKEKVLDFLLKLDTATLHIVTGPIHTIDAVTGWDLSATVEHAAKKSKDILKDIWATLKELQNKVLKAFDDTRKKTLVKQISDLEAMIPKPVTVKA